MYRLTKGIDYILLIVYVDDLLYIGSTNNVITWFEGELHKDLTLTVSSTVTQYLGLNIQEDEDAIYLNAAKYADTIAKRFALTPTTHLYAIPLHGRKQQGRIRSTKARRHTRLPEKAGMPPLRSCHLPSGPIVLRKPARDLPQET
ncbi:unnamed protein product [Closterium sp. NIES-54]